MSKLNCLKSIEAYTYCQVKKSTKKLNNCPKSKMS